MKTTWLGLAVFGALVLFGISVSMRQDRQVEADRIFAPSDAYDPVAAGEETPPGYRQIFPRDAHRAGLRPDLRLGVGF